MESHVVLLKDGRFPIGVLNIDSGAALWWNAVADALRHPALLAVYGRGTIGTDTAPSWNSHR
jgi:hypothetical protein